MEPIVDELDDQYGREFDLVRVDIDTGRGRALARVQAFVGQPTFIFFDSSGEEVRRLQGPQTRDILEREIQRTLGQ